MRDLKDTQNERDDRNLPIDRVTTRLKDGIFGQILINDLRFLPSS